MVGGPMVSVSNGGKSSDEKVNKFSKYLNKEEICNKYNLHMSNFLLKNNKKYYTFEINENIKKRK